MPPEESYLKGYEWTALSVTTVGALLASIQGSALLIALPEILTRLQTDCITIMWVLLGYLLVTTAFVPVVGRLADMFGRKNLYNSGFAIFTLGSLLCGMSQPPVPWVGSRRLPPDPGAWRCASLYKQRNYSNRCISPGSRRPWPRSKPDSVCSWFSPRPCHRRHSDINLLAMGSSSSMCPLGQQGPSGVS